MALLTAENLSVLRGDRVLLQNFSLHIGAGELVHLRGANGVGKTSLLETLAGLRRAGGGRVELAEPDSGLHWLGHRNGLNLSLSPVENLQFWCGLNGVDARGVPDSLQRLAVPARAQRRACRSLSAGQKRRSALARLLLQRRPLWLLDEPLDGLDAAGLGLFAELVSAHCAQGGAVLMTSHQLLPGALQARELSL